MPRITITPSGFAQGYRRFQDAVKAHPDSESPFVDFRSGLAEVWERYKTWLHGEAVHRLGAHNWDENLIGSGHILKHFSVGFCGLDLGTFTANAADGGKRFSPPTGNFPSDMDDKFPTATQVLGFIGLKLKSRLKRLSSNCH